MATYVTAFIFYTLAMIGIMLVGFVVYKKTFQTEKGANKGIIKVIDSLPIGNKKMLLVVKIKDEKFLIASGLEHTTFLAKLDENNSLINTKEQILTPEVVDMALVEQIHNENFSQQQQTRFDDAQKIRAAEIQKQFKELYEKDERVETAPVIDEATKRKEMLKQLLKEYHKDGNKF